MAILDEIASKAGVSPKTVSNILSGRLQYRRKDAMARAERVRQVARELNYMPNMAARAMSTGRFNAITMIHATNYGQSFMPPMLWTGIHRASLTHHQMVLSTMVEDETLSDANAMPVILREMAADGMLIDYINDAPQGMLDLIEQHRMPAIWINNKLPHDCVYPDDLWAGREMTQHMIDAGHTRIAFANRRIDSHYSVIDRLAGYEQVMHEFGLVSNVLPLNAYLARGERAEEYRSLLQVPERPTAVVCYDPGEAMSLVHAATQFGLSVPDDLSVAAVSDGEICDLGFEIASARHRFGVVGETAVQRLMQKIDEPAMQFSPTPIQGLWRPGASIARHEQR